MPRSEAKRKRRRTDCSTALLLLKSGSYANSMEASRQGRIAPPTKPKVASIIARDAGSGTTGRANGQEDLSIENTPLALVQAARVGPGSMPAPVRSFS